MNREEHGPDEKHMVFNENGFTVKTDSGDYLTFNQACDIAAFPIYFSDENGNFVKDLPDEEIKCFYDELKKRVNKLHSEK